MRNTPIALLAALAFTNGCSADNGSSTGTSSAAQICAADFKREKSCDSRVGTIESEWLDWCELSVGCFNKGFDPAYVQALWTCRPQVACGESDDACGESVMLSNYDQPYIKAKVDDCLAKSEACCQQETGCFASDLCLGLAVANDKWRNALEACLDGPCGQVRSCSDAWVESEGCTGYHSSPSPGPTPMPPP